MTEKLLTGNPGDWIEVHSTGGGAPRRGQILEVLDHEGSRHYRVRWTDDHETIFFPADGTHITPAAAPPQR